MESSKLPKEQLQYCTESYYLCKNCPKFSKCESPVKGIIKE